MTLLLLPVINNRPGLTISNYHAFRKEKGQYGLRVIISSGKGEGRATTGPGLER